MTESEAKGFIQGKLDCMNKCGVFNKEDNISDNDCDNCEYCYSQGNFGEQKEAFSVAINALEKQIAKNPISYDDCEQFVIRCTCGKCTDTRFFRGYCTWCGQKLDFGE